MDTKLNEQGLETTGNIEFDVFGIRHTIEVREESEHHEAPWKYRRTKARAFVWSEKLYVNDAPLREIAKLVGAKDIHTKRGDFPLLDEAWKLHNELEALLLAAVLKKGLQALGFENEKVKFSEYAGCSCGCSPGFIFVSNENIKGWFNVFVQEVEVENTILQGADHEKDCMSN